MISAFASSSAVECGARLEAVRLSAGPLVEVIDTPNSWVMLTHNYAYKFRKPGRDSDARTESPDRRKQACFEEVWLNRRLAPDVYLGAVPLSRVDDGSLQLAGKGEPVEWAVKMRRLRSEVSLGWLFERGGPTPGQVAALGAVFASFYRESPPVTDSVDRLMSRFRARVNDPRLAPERLPALLRGLAARVRRAQEAYFDAAHMILNLRVSDGRIIDGHGDLRPEHIFLERRPAVIDCLVENAQRRRTDALDDLSTLAMECRRHERTDVAETLLAAYRHSTGDEEFPRLEAFYRSLAATQRAAELLDAPATYQRADATSDALAYLSQAESDAELLI